MWVLGFIINLFCLFSLQSGLDSKTKAELAPYLLPDDHPAKPILDSIFSESRVLFNLKTLVDAGFLKSKPRDFSHLIVTKHPALPGYVFKLYLDSQRFHSMNPEYHFWKLRINGANLVRQEIAARGLSSQMKVPNKWIYLLPDEPEPDPDYYPKYTIIIEDDMDLVSNDENYAIWKSNAITPEFLTTLYHFLKDLGMQDCAKPDNIPFSHDGRIAFIDTQSYGLKKVWFKKLTKFLSDENREVWKALIE